jgi:hypothetical protein
LRYEWFQIFWLEYRSKALDRSINGLVQAIASHWDTWWSVNESRYSGKLPATSRDRKKFLRWVIGVWRKHEYFLLNHHRAINFILSQLATCRPFSEWPELSRYKHIFGVRHYHGVVENSSVVMAGIEAIAVPREDGPEIKQDERAPLFTMPARAASVMNEAASAARGLLCGWPLYLMMSIWLLLGRRPYSIAIGSLFFAGWLACGVLLGALGSLSFRTDVVESLALLLTALWIGVLLLNLVWNAACIVRACRQGRNLAELFDASTIVLRSHVSVDGPESLGLAVMLRSLLALHEADGTAAGRSSFWRLFFRSLKRGGSAKGQISRWGFIGSVGDRHCGGQTPAPGGSAAGGGVLASRPFATRSGAPLLLFR